MDRAEAMALYQKLVATIPRRAQGSDRSLHIAERAYV
jgi:hypothetical protein